MGVKGAFPFLKKEGYVANRVYPRDVQGFKHVDLMALFYWYIATRLKTLLQRQYRQKFWTIRNAMETEPATSLLSDENFQQLAREISKKLEADFDMADCLLHFDGRSTLEKQAEHANRAARYKDDRDEADMVMHQILGRANTIRERNPPAVTSSDRTRLVQWSKTASKHWRAVLGVPQYVRTGLANALAQLGWGIHHCPGESDTCIAQGQSAGVQTIVVSTDSDYLFRSRDDMSLILLRQNTKKRREFTRYDTHAARATTGLSPASWRVLAITSGNDYAKNKKGWGLTKNSRLIKTLYNQGVRSEDDILRRYCQVTYMDVRHFDHAVTVFVFNAQTLLPPAAATVELDDLYLDSVFAVGINLQLYVLLDEANAGYYGL